MGVLQLATSARYSYSTLKLQEIQGYADTYGMSFCKKFDGIKTNSLINKKMLILLSTIVKIPLQSRLNL